MMRRGKDEQGGRTPRPSVLVCVLTAAISAAAVALSCADTTTTLCEKSGRRCSPGQTCAASQDVCIEIGGCGDGIIDPDKGEVCDDGNIEDGHMINGAFVADDCRHDCMSTQKCGNGITDPAAGETCDGEANCSSDCHLQACGNGILDPGEVCDDGNALPDDGCSAKCNSNEACGNGFKDDDGPGGILHEECEFPDAPFPGPVHDSADCNNDCTLPRCGDGHTNTLFNVTDAGPPHLEECDSGVMGVRMDSPICDDDCTIPICGDQHVNHEFIPPGASSGEDCDDGDHNSDTRPDACRKNCHAAFCGDGVLDRIATPTHPLEECDDGSDMDHDLDHDGKINSNTLPDACRMDCRRAFCGDTITDTNEDCDTGGMDTVSCNADCTTPSCGDNHINSAAGEICEPGDSHHEQSGCPPRQTCVSVGASACRACI